LLLVRARPPVDGKAPTPSKVATLEAEFAKQNGVKYALAVSSGTSALMCGLVALGVGPRDEVIVPAYTWVASAGAIIAVGGMILVTL